MPELTVDLKSLDGKSCGELLSHSSALKEPHGGSIRRRRLLLH
jgi:hypothetical protein